MGSKQGQLTRFSQFMSHFKRKNCIKNFYKNCNLESFRPFSVYKEFITTSIGK